MKATCALGLASAALIACAEGSLPPEDQWQVYIATDATVPQLGDRLLIEVLDAQNRPCTGCRRELGVTDPAQWPLSFGIAAPEGGGTVRVRARLYRTALTGPDGPVSDRLIDALVELPSPHEVTDVAIELRMDCFGVPADLDGLASCDPTTGRPTSIGVAPEIDDPAALPEPGSFPAAARVDCPGPADPDMVCVPGGLFLLGNPIYYPIDAGIDGTDPVPEQLVRVSPFFLDRAEFTVADMRSVVDSAGQPLAYDPEDAPECTYLADGDTNDSLPVNCVTREKARLACAAKNKRLPSEAEWEWAAGNLELESQYPWADGSDDICNKAVVATGTDSSNQSSSASCFRPDVAPGPREGGNAADVTALGLLNMGGNVTEWTDDDFVGYGDTVCWGPSASIRVDPHCSSAGSTPISKGTSWQSREYFAHVFIRADEAEGNHSGIGFRCAK